MAGTEVDQLLASLEQLLPRTNQVLYHRADDPFRTLSVNQLRLIRAIAEGPCPPGRIAELLGVSPSAVTQIVARLKDAGLVVDQSASLDRRMKLVELSPEGRKLLDERSEGRIASSRPILSELDGSTLAHLADILRQIVDLAEHLSTPDHEAV